MLSKSLLTIAVQAAMQKVIFPEQVKAERSRTISSSRAGMTLGSTKKETGEDNEKDNLDEVQAGR